jgi:hypothetical protein
MSVVFMAADRTLALALLIFGDTIYCIQAIKQQEVTNYTAEIE